MEKKGKFCQFCGTKYQVTTWIPAGNMCNECHKNLLTIRKLKLGIPRPRITKEKHEELKKDGKKND